MPIFHYRALSLDGHEVTGVEEAASALAAVERLSNMQLLPLDIDESKPSTSLFRKLLPQKIPMQVHLQALDHMASLLDAGISVTATLQTIADQMEHPKLRQLLGEVSVEVQNGKQLWESLDAYPEYFPSLHRNMIRAGEESGNLTDVLHRLVEHIEREQELRGKVVEASIYPAIIFCVAVVVVGLLLAFVVPQFTKILSNTGVELPAPTKVLIAVSDFIRGYGLYAVGVAVVIAATVRPLFRRPKVAAFRDAMILKIPLVGSLIKKAAIARFSRTLGTLLESGLPILSALELVAPILGNVVLKDCIHRLSYALQAGEDLTTPLRRESLFPPMVIQMVSVGEKTGDLDRMLGKMGTLYDKQVDAAAKKLTVALEPMLIVGIGIVVGFVALALMLPMLKAVTSLSH